MRFYVLKAFFFMLLETCWSVLSIPVGNTVFVNSPLWSDAQYKGMCDPCALAHMFFLYLKYNENL